ncbi:MAG: ABC transporter substrate binding protein [Gallionellaceae bacterium]
MNIFSNPLRINSPVSLLAGVVLLLSVALPAGANSFETGLPPDYNVLSQENYINLINELIDDRDIAVIPIHIADSVVATATKNLNHKIAEAAVGTIAVIYPDIGEPYRSVFAQIIDGIESKAKGKIANYAIGPNSDITEINNALRRQDAKVVIALGQQGMKASSMLDSNIGVVVGGVLTAPANKLHDHQVNSLSPDPALLFSHLKGMMPKVRRVFTVYDPRQNTWLINLAKEAARAQGLELIAHEALDLRSAMQAYQTIFALSDSSQDALWLPQDSTAVEEGTALPMVLQESWRRNLAVFSSNFGHVRRGVLFSLYPNNVELGRYLAGSALFFLAEGENEQTGMLPLREVLMAINLRTAKHLGINTSRQQNFALAFPEK